MFDFLEKHYDENRIENGAWHHFTDDDGEPIYLPKADGTPDLEKPARALIRSLLSTAYDKLNDDAMKSMSSKARRLKSDEKRRLAALQEMKEQQPKACSVLVVKFENISLVNPGIVTPSPADIMTFASKPKNAPWVKQIIEFAGDNANYGGADSEAVKEGNAADAA